MGQGGDTEQEGGKQGCKEWDTGRGYRAGHKWEGGGARTNGYRGVTWPWCTPEGHYTTFICL